MLVYDPINLENIPINDYLKNDSNNIVIVLNKKAYGVNKALFMFNNEMKRCIIANNALLKKATYDNPDTFYNIGYFIGKKVIVNLNTLNDVLKEHRIIELTSKTTGDTYINKELLELSTIIIVGKLEIFILLRRCMLFSLSYFLSVIFVNPPSLISFSQTPLNTSQ
jgi:hypothetical protein